MISCWIQPNGHYFLWNSMKKCHSSYRITVFWGFKKIKWLLWGLYSKEQSVERKDSGTEGQVGALKTQRIQDGVKDLLNAAQVNTYFLQFLGKLNTEITCSHSHHAGAQLEEKNQPSAHLHNPRNLLQNSKEWLERRQNRTHKKELLCPNSVISPRPLIVFFIPKCNQIYRRKK